jgi:AraC family transcriptional regulator of adaptative response / DNA-3-methyladenine glycosylase II
MGFAAVATTGIYCRPSCGASPKPSNVHLFPLAASAEAAGYRACFRCRPYRTEPDRSWTGSQLVCRAVRLILEGALDDASEGDLAARLFISGRHLRRIFQEELGVTPDYLARSARAHFARRLLDDTDLTISGVAFAAGFGSTRQFHRACREIFRGSPTELRARRRVADRLVADGGLSLRLPYSGPLDWEATLQHLRARAIAGVENVERDTYRRTIVVDGDPGVLELRPGGTDHVVMQAHLPHWEGLIHVARRARRIVNLDADMAGANDHLDADAILGPLVRARPGVRPPGTWDPFETGVQAAIDDLIGEAAGRSVLARVVERFGTPVAGLHAIGLTHVFPAASVLATADLRDLGITAEGAARIRGFATAVADGAVRFDRTTGLDQLLDSLTTIACLDLGTAHYLALRMGEPDAFPDSRVGLSGALAGEQDRPPVAGALERLAGAWRPWRAHAAAQLMTHEHTSLHEGAGDADVVRSPRQAVNATAR